MVDLISLLANKKVKVTEIPKWGTYLRKKWEDHFANHLDLHEKKSIYLDGFLWHVFSYEKREYLQKEKADLAFNNESKKSCYVFYQHSDEAFILENATGLAADDFLNEEDVYVVDKEFNWTYVRTHETGWFGPYFCRKRMSS
ncbi:DUF4275 family protein [Niallia sp. Krafla_26]|uniref:DUF4275 family protein n=1 Tax=Niallia sp. Krafla_26 TaxID=3064703 RepID=UPI003D1778B9